MYYTLDVKIFQVYHVKGRFGYATDNFFQDGKFVQRVSYGITFIYNLILIYNIALPHI